MLKFSEQDRKAVISKIEQILDTKLSSVGTRRKLLEDPEKKLYLVLGGYDNWHGIPRSLIEQIEKRNGNGVLCIARRTKSKIEIFIGSLDDLIQNKDDLSKTQNGDYQFNIFGKGGSLALKETSNVVLKNVGTISYSEADSKKDKNATLLEREFSKLSPSEQKVLLETLKNKVS